MRRTLQLQIIRRFSGTSVINVYGHYASQPVRAVTWLLKIQNHPFLFHKVDVASGEHRKASYRDKFSTALIPGLEDNGFYLVEGSAILKYLCESNNWTSWWPTGTTLQCIQDRAKISEYLSHHHGLTRQLSITVMRPFFNATFSGKLWSENERQGHETQALKIAKRFETIFLSSGPFINGFQQPTIADLFAYPEIAQLQQCGLVDYSELPRLCLWMDRMKSLPGHDDVHKTLFKIAEMGGLQK